MDYNVVLLKKIAYLLQYMGGIFTIAKCYFLPNLSLLLRISKIFIHLTHILRKSEDYFSAYSLAIS